MAFNISNIFRPTQQTTQAPQQGQAPQQAMPPAPPPGTPGSTMQIQNPAAGDPNPPATNDSADNSPLDAWKDVWHTDPKATTPADPWSQPILPSDPNKIREAASKMDMMAGMPPELMQKAMAGNDPQALMDLMNRVAQNTLAMSAQLATASVERAGTVIRDRTKQELPDQFRDYQLNNLPVESPVLNHPGAQGLLQMTRQQLKMKNPSWSAQQIQDQAVKYLSSFAGALSQSDAPQQPKTDRNGTPEQDWDSFL
jgi:hypothetical protein